MHGNGLEADSGQRLEGRLKQMAGALLADAQEAIKQRQHRGEAEVVHQVRVAMKRFRAFLRLVRSELSVSLYRTLNERCRRLAASLAEERDTEVAQATLRRLIDNHALADSGSHLLQALQAQGRQAKPSTALAWPALAAEIAGLQDACTALPLQKLTSNDLKRALCKSCRQGRKGWRQARKGADVQQLHEWRKVVKHACYQLQLIDRKENKQVRQLKKLSDCLGDLHDLDMLEQRLLVQRHRYWLEDICNCQPCLDAQRHMLYQQALAEGGRIYAHGKLETQVKRMVKSLARW